MSYEIPQKLQYEEKIIFGLTFRQLVFVPIFIIPALVIFLKSHLPITIRLIVSTALMGLGLLFMFFNLLDYLKNIIAWVKFREASQMDKRMKDFLGLKKVENKVLYVKRN